LRQVWFRYTRGGPDVLRGLTLAAPRGAVVGLVGGNGVGKSTALGVLAGLLAPHRGRASLGGKAALLPQDPQTVFVKKTLELDLAHSLEPRLAGQAARLDQARAAARRVGLAGLEQVHPYDLSGGEQQRAALAKALLAEPDILLLDEPTKGLDAAFKATLADLLKNLAGRGASVIMATHDIEFCARHADLCGLMFDGGLTNLGPPREFLAGHAFYTTAANRMARHLWPDAILAEEVVARCRQALAPAPAGGR
jgi:energy-coupling factor transport system ATP-binding protein